MNGNRNYNNHTNLELKKSSVSSGKLDVIFLRDTDTQKPVENHYDLRVIACSQDTHQLISFFYLQSLLVFMFEI